MDMIEQRKRNRGQGGFTLIELLVVIAILAILAGVAVFAVNGLTTDADKNACELEKDVIKTAQQAALAADGAAGVPADYIDDAETKYWAIPTTPSAAIAPKSGVTLPTGCN
jgi:prepilin-type N-terminal cleavage/methylation domain-containing protein